MDGTGIEIVYSQSEQIGLPNWSNVNLLVSAKGSTPVGQESAGYDHLHAVVNRFVIERSERIAKSVSMYYGANPDPRDLVASIEPHQDPASLFTSNIETVFSLHESVGLPSSEKGVNHSIKLMASAKGTWSVTSMLEGLAYLADTVQAQMGQKRGVVLANPRPWITTT